MPVELIQLVQVAALFLPLQALLFQGLSDFPPSGASMGPEAEARLYSVLLGSMSMTALAAVVAIYGIAFSLILPGPLEIVQLELVIATPSTFRRDGRVLSLLLLGGGFMLVFSVIRRLTQLVPDPEKF